MSQGRRPSQLRSSAIGVLAGFGGIVVIVILSLAASVAGLLP